MDAEGMAEKRNRQFCVKNAKITEELVIGFGFICEKKNADGEFEPHVDAQGDFIPEEVMYEGMKSFMAGNRVAKDMHEGESIGQIVYGFPLTQDICKALSIETEQTGFLIAMKPNAEVMAKFKSGEYTGFSLGGYLASYENPGDDEDAD